MLYLGSLLHSGFVAAQTVGIEPAIPVPFGIGKDRRKGVLSKEIGVGLGFPFIA